MAVSLDDIDRKILRALQKDASVSMDGLADQIGMSRNACWRRAKSLEKAGFIRKRVAIVDAKKVGCDLSVFVLIKTAQHNTDWLDRFERAVSGMPEIMGAHRMAGELDYILRVRVGSVDEYDAFYQRLISKVPIANISASFVMDDIKDTTELPL